jgi:hypothetical protein
MTVNSVKMPNVTRRMPFVISGAIMKPFKMELYLCVNPSIERKKNEDNADLKNLTPLGLPNAIIKKEWKTKL